MTLAVLAAITMTVGNLLALPQTNIKRLIAFSSVAHAGYALIGVVALTQLGAASVVFYLAAYIATNLLAFGIVMAFSRVTGLEDLKDYAGMSRRTPLAGTDDAVRLPVAGGHAALWRFCGKGCCLRGGHSGWLCLAGDHRYHQFGHRCVLLFECDEVCLSLSYAGCRMRKIIPCH